MGLPDALSRLSASLSSQDLALDIPGAAVVRTTRTEIVDQIEDYLLPRLREMEAPLLMVVGGSTGAGKSTLVNSLVGDDVTRPGVLRPTTRAPVLACHPDDRHWFEDDRVLGGMPRTIGSPAGPGGLELAPTPALPIGLALLDSPDIDSVVEANRDLARQLLAAADAWLFVTTAARYADAVPWELLQAARERGTSLSVVLNRVPPEAVGEVTDHLRAMLAERGLPDAELLTVPEITLEEGRVPAAALAPVRGWLDDLAADASARAGVVRRTLTGALDSLPARVGAVAAALTEQETTANALREDAQRAYATSGDEIEEALRAGALLRGEVLARWHEVIGTGDLMRAVESRIGKVRDRLRTLVTGSAPPDAELKAAVTSSLDGLIAAAADRAAERAAEAWTARPAGRSLLEGGERLDAPSPGLADRTRDAVRAWQEAVFDLVAREGADKRGAARAASLGVNGAGLGVMLVTFAHTGGLTGAEVAVAGGTSAVGQRLLEAMLGDQAVRTLATRAREDLMERVRALMATEEERFETRLAPLTPPAGAAGALRDALAAVERSR